MVGTRRLLEEQRVAVPAEASALLEQLDATGQSTLLVARDGVVLGVIGARDRVRPEAIRYPPGAEALPDVWLEARSQLRSVLENITFADLVRRSRARAGRLEPSAAGEGAGT